LVINIYIMSTKICKKCNIEKSVESFHKWKQYYKSQCKDCVNSSRVEYHKNYRSENSIQIKNRIVEYNKNNKEKRKDSQKKWSDKNPNYMKDYQENRLKSDLLFKISRSIRTRISKSISRQNFRKTSKTSEILGCSFLEFKSYIESKFESWMTWENRGLYNGEFNYGWDLDHIIPISEAKNEEDVIKLNHYTNFQPLCSKTNRDLKKNKLEYEQR
jgi:hypothetical protein